jgi:SsrA-binding protein
MDITFNRKATFDYHLLEKFEAGMVLKGDEIKSIRAHKVNLKGALVKILISRINQKKTKEEKTVPEVFLINSYIESSQSPTRTRKLLMKSQEIKSLLGKVQEKGLTLVPIRIYLKRGKAKIEIALARGKKQYDKREKIKKREVEREIRRNLE